MCRFHADRGGSHIIKSGGDKGAYMLKIGSPEFKDGEQIPVEFTGEGDNQSPPLEWSGITEHTKELAILCQDPDAQGDRPFVHWLIYGLSPQLTGLPAGIPYGGEIHDPVHAVQGTNDFGHQGYGGPLPPAGHGWHRYYFKLFELDEKLDLSPGITVQEFLDSTRGHILAEAEFVGRYIRESRREISNDASELQT
jgi:Raf kinase inhibitor-like YbhB/YbcL family protein